MILYKYVYMCVCVCILTFYDNCVLFQVRMVLFCFAFLFHNFITLSSLIYRYEACVRMNTRGKNKNKKLLNMIYVSL